MEENLMFPDDKLGISSDVQLLIADMYLKQSKTIVDISKELNINRFFVTKVTDAFMKFTMNQKRLEKLRAENQPVKKLSEGLRKKYLSFIDRQESIQNYLGA